MQGHGGHAAELVVEAADQRAAQHGDAGNADQGERDGHQQQHGGDQPDPQRRAGQQPPPRLPGSGHEGGNRVPPRDHRS